MSRLNGFYYLLILTIGILVTRLVYLQVFEGAYYRRLAEENRIKSIRLPAQRGRLLDRYGQPFGDLGPAGSQVLGFVGEADEAEANQYYLHAIVGKTGLEQQYDALLRGTDGASIVEQEADGTVLRELKRFEPVKGKDVKTSLDAGLMAKTYAVLANRRGAAVISRPETGEILALVSSPGFDPKNLEKVLKDSNLPFFNRAISGEYPPGSVFKVVTAAAGLEEGKINPGEQIEDTGAITIGPYRYTNWYFTQYGRTDGWLNVAGALKRSNDIFFYRLGERLGIKALADWARYLGLGNNTGIDLPGEAAGLMPDAEWKKKNIGEDWYTGDTFISAIGQGNVLATPIQINQMMGVIAGQGLLCQPFLVGRQDCRKLDLNKATLEIISQGLREVCQPGGTAWPFFDYSVPVSGKTGTAEFADTQNRTHAWFSGYAPADKPEIMVTVLLEAAGEGSNQAAPVAREIFQYWFERQQ